MSSLGKNWAPDHSGCVYSAVTAPACFIFKKFCLGKDAECSKEVFTKINLLNFGESLGQKGKTIAYKTRNCYLLAKISRCRQPLSNKHVRF